MTPCFARIRSHRKRRCSIARLVNALVIAIPLTLSASAYSTHLPPERWRVLIMQGGDPYLPSAVAQDRGIRDVFSRATDASTEFITEPLHTLESSSPVPDAVVTQYLNNKFASRKPDIIIALRQPALEFLERNADTLWPDVPIVFCGIPDDYFGTHTLPARVSGVRIAFDVAGTLDLARRFQPNADRVALIAGTSSYDQAWRGRVESVVSSRFKDLPMIWISDAPIEDMLERVSQLPPQTIILYSSVFRDARGRTFIPRDLISLFSERAHSPIYSFFDTYLGAGIIGGSISSWAEQGMLAGQMALRILRHPGAHSPVIMPAPPSTVSVDMLEMERWKIDPNLVPADTRFLHRPDSLLERYRVEICVVILVLIAQASVIGALMLERLRVRRAERMSVR
jgi:hypothetical protein